MSRLSEKCLCQTNYSVASLVRSEGTVKEAGHRGQVPVDGGQARLHVVFVTGGPGKVDVLLGLGFLGLCKGGLAPPGLLLQHELITEGDLLGQLGSNSAKPVADGFSPAVIPVPQNPKTP